MANTLQFEEFEPYCKWQRDEASVVLQINIPGFKKENLKVQLNNAGFLLITGERVVDQTKGTRFRKELRVPDDCVRNEIRAKLTGGNLYITMPKKSFLANTKTQLYDLRDQLSQEQIAKQKLEQLVGRPGDSKTGWLRMLGLRSPRMDGKSALKLGALAAVVVVVSVGAYIACKHHKCLHGDMTTN